MFDCEVAISFSLDSDDLLVFINHFILMLLLSSLFVFKGLGTTVNIFSSLCKHFQLWANIILCRRSTFELNLLLIKSDNQDKLGHQS